MAASMCDVFSFCVGVAGRAGVAVEVRFVSSAKVRPRRTRREPPTLSGLGTSPTGSKARSLEAPLPLGRCGSSLLAARRLPVCPRAQASGEVTRWTGGSEVFVRAPPSRGTWRASRGPCSRCSRRGRGGAGVRGVGGEGGGAGLFGPGWGTLLLGSGYGGREYAEQRELRYKKAWVLRELPE